jgi:hypothetical protein
MFAAHPGVYVPLRETRVFKQPEKARRRYDMLLEEARATGRPFLVEKTPSHLHRIDLIRELVPDARFIVPVRDGRDVVASIARRSGSVEEGIRRWKRDTAAILEQRDRDDVFTYRHEDLIDDARSVLQAACAFADIPFDDAMLQYHRVPRRWHGQRTVKDADPAKNHAAHRNWQINQPVFDNRGRWVEELSQVQIRPLLEGHGGQIMRAFDYLS